MARFKVGDKVVGNDNANREYGITTTGWKGIVKEVREDGICRIEGRDGSEKSLSGQGYRVHERYFSKVNE